MTAPAATPELTALDILKAARAKIARQEDWGKGRRYLDRPYETCCAAEAIEECSFTCERTERRRAIDALYCAAGLDKNWGAITDWNDATERTHRHVIAAYDLAIATLDLS